MIKIYKTPALEPRVKGQLDALINNEFGHIPIVKETQWATPDWTIIYYEGNEIATFYNIVERTVTIDGKDYFSAGINNVITPPSFRGKGFSTKTLRDTESFIFNEIKAEIGVLLCADDLLPFYQRLGWYQVNCPVYFDQPSGKKRWMANTMLRSVNKEMHPQQIDLNGLPW